MASPGILEMTARVFGHGPVEGEGSSMCFATDDSHSEYAHVKCGPRSQMRKRASKRVDYELDTSFGHVEGEWIGKVKLGDRRVMFLLNQAGRKQIKADAIRIHFEVDEAERREAVNALVELFKDDPNAVVDVS